MPRRNTNFEFSLRFLQFSFFNSPLASTKLSFLTALINPCRGNETLSQNHRNRACGLVFASAVC